MGDPRAYLIELPKCRCGKTATVEIKNGVNASMGRFCKPCGSRELKRLRETG